MAAAAAAVSVLECIERVVRGGLAESIGSSAHAFFCLSRWCRTIAV